MSVFEPPFLVTHKSETPIAQKLITEDMYKKNEGYVQAKM